MPDLLETAIDKLLGEAVAAGNTQNHHWLTKAFQKLAIETGLTAGVISEAYFDVLNVHLGITD